MLKHPFRFASELETWYPVCPSAALRRKQIRSLEIGDRSLVLFRTESGKLHALSAHCSHLGTHLGRGAVLGEYLRCPLHHWQYDGHGQRQASPNGVPAPEGVCQLAYPVAERYGLVFVFNGRHPHHPPPSFPLPDRNLRWLTGRTVFIRCHWAAIVANAYDMEHFQSVHERALVDVPLLEQPDPHRLILRYVSRVTGRTASDLAMRFLSRDRIDVTITCWGGGSLTVETHLGNIRSRLLLGFRPTEGGTEIYPTFLAPRTALPARDALVLRAARWLFGAFLQRDISILEGTRFQPAPVLPQDEVLNQFLVYLTTLPEALPLPGPGGRSAWAPTHR